MNRFQPSIRAQGFSFSMSCEVTSRNEKMPITRHRAQLQNLSSLTRQTPRQDAAENNVVTGEFDKWHQEGSFSTEEFMESECSTGLKIHTSLETDSSVPLQFLVMTAPHPCRTELLATPPHEESRGVIHDPRLLRNQSPAKRLKLLLPLRSRTAPKMPRSRMAHPPACQCSAISVLSHRSSTRPRAGRRSRQMVKEE